MTVETVRPADRTRDDASAQREKEAQVRELATHDGLRLEKSRRSNDLTSGPVLYWLVDATGAIVTPKSGERLDALTRYLTASR